MWVCCLARYTTLSLFRIIQEHPPRNAPFSSHTDSRFALPAVSLLLSMPHAPSTTARSCDGNEQQLVGAVPRYITLPYIAHWLMDHTFSVWRRFSRREQRRYLSYHAKLLAKLSQLYEELLLDDSEELQDLASSQRWVALFGVLYFLFFACACLTYNISAQSAQSAALGIGTVALVTRMVQRQMHWNVWPIADYCASIFPDVTPEPYCWELAALQRALGVPALGLRSRVSCGVQLLVDAIRVLDSPAKPATTAGETLHQEGSTQGATVRVSLLEHVVAALFGAPDERGVQTKTAAGLLATTVSVVLAIPCNFIVSFFVESPTAPTTTSGKSPQGAVGKQGATDRPSLLEQVLAALYEGSKERVHHTKSATTIFTTMFAMAVVVPLFFTTSIFVAVRTFDSKQLHLCGPGIPLLPRHRATLRNAAQMPGVAFDNSMLRVCATLLGRPLFVKSFDIEVRNPRMRAKCSCTQAGKTDRALLWSLAGFLLHCLYALFCVSPMCTCQAVTRPEANVSPLFHGWYVFAPSGEQVPARGVARLHAGDVFGVHYVRNGHKVGHITLISKVRVQDLTGTDIEFINGNKGRAPWLLAAGNTPTDDSDSDSEVNMTMVGSDRDFAAGGAPVRTAAPAPLPAASPACAPMHTPAAVGASLSSSVASSSAFVPLPHATSAHRGRLAARGGGATASASMAHERSLPPVPVLAPLHAHGDSVQPTSASGSPVVPAAALTAAAFIAAESDSTAVRTTRAVCTSRSAAPLPARPQSATTPAASAAVAALHDCSPGVASSAASARHLSGSGAQCAPSTAAAAAAAAAAAVAAAAAASAASAGSIAASAAVSSPRPPATFNMQAPFVLGTTGGGSYTIVVDLHSFHTGVHPNLIRTVPNTEAASFFNIGRGLLACLFPDSCPGNYADARIRHAEIDDPPRACGPAQSRATDTPLLIAVAYLTAPWTAASHRGRLTVATLTLDVVAGALVWVPDALRRSKDSPWARAADAFRHSRDSRGALLQGVDLKHLPALRYVNVIAEHDTVAFYGPRFTGAPRAALRNALYAVCKVKRPAPAPQPVPPPPALPQLLHAGKRGRGGRPVSDLVSDSISAAGNFILGTTYTGLAITSAGDIVHPSLAEVARAAARDGTTGLRRFTGRSAGSAPPAPRGRVAGGAAAAALAAATAAAAGLPVVPSPEPDAVLRVLSEATVALPPASFGGRIAAAAAALAHVAASVEGAAAAAAADPVLHQAGSALQSGEAGAGGVPSFADVLPATLPPAHTSRRALPGPVPLTVLTSGEVARVPGMWGSVHSLSNRLQHWGVAPAVHNPGEAAGLALIASSSSAACSATLHPKKVLPTDAVDPVKLMSAHPQAVQAVAMDMTDHTYRIEVLSDALPSAQVRHHAIAYADLDQVTIQIRGRVAPAVLKGLLEAAASLAPPARAPVVSAALDISDDRLVAPLPSPELGAPHGSTAGSCAAAGDAEVASGARVDARATNAAMTAEGAGVAGAGAAGAPAPEGVAPDSRVGTAGKATPLAIVVLRHLRREGAVPRAMETTEVLVCSSSIRGPFKQPTLLPGPHVNSSSFVAGPPMQGIAPCNSYFFGYPRADVEAAILDAAHAVFEELTPSQAHKQLQLRVGGEYRVRICGGPLVILAAAVLLAARDTSARGRGGVIFETYNGKARALHSPVNLADLCASTEAAQATAHCAATTIATALRLDVAGVLLRMHRSPLWAPDCVNAMAGIGIVTAADDAHGARLWGSVPSTADASPRGARGTFLDATMPHHERAALRAAAAVGARSPGAAAGGAGAPAPIVAGAGLAAVPPAAPKGAAGSCAIDPSWGSQPTGGGAPEMPSAADTEAALTAAVRPQPPPPDDSNHDVDATDEGADMCASAPRVTTGGHVDYYPSLLLPRALSGMTEYFKGNVVNCLSINKVQAYSPLVRSAERETGPYAQRLSALAGNVAANRPAPGEAPVLNVGFLREKFTAFMRAANSSLCNLLKGCTSRVEVTFVVPPPARGAASVPAVAHASGTGDAEADAADVALLTSALRASFQVSLYRTRWWPAHTVISYTAAKLAGVGAVHSACLAALSEGVSGLQQLEVLSTFAATSVAVSSFWSGRRGNYTPFAFHAALAAAAGRPLSLLSHLPSSVANRLGCAATALRHTVPVFVVPPEANAKAAIVRGLQLEAQIKLSVSDAVATKKFVHQCQGCWKHYWDSDDLHGHLVLSPQCRSARPATGVQLTPQLYRTIEEREVHDADFTLAQRTAYEAVLSGKNVVVIGEAGTGKTYVLRLALRHILRRYCNREAAVAATAFTGLASQQVWHLGTTFHSFCSLGLFDATPAKIEEAVAKARGNAALTLRARALHTLLIDEAGGRYTQQVMPSSARHAAATSCPSEARRSFSRVTPCKCSRLQRSGEMVPGSKTPATHACILCSPLRPL